MNQTEFRVWLQDLLTGAFSDEDDDSEYERADKIKFVSSFEDALVMTRNEGLVVRLHDGSEFQVAIVRVK